MPTEMCFYIFHVSAQVCCLVVLTDAKLPTTYNYEFGKFWNSTPIQTLPLTIMLCGAYLTDANLPIVTDLTHDEGPHMEQHQEPRERRNFPETWLWMDYHTGWRISR